MINTGYFQAYPCKTFVISEVFSIVTVMYGFIVHTLCDRIRLYVLYCTVLCSYHGSHNVINGNLMEIIIISIRFMKNVHTKHILLIK